MLLLTSLMTGDNLSAALLKDYVCSEMAEVKGLVICRVQRVAMRAGFRVL